MNVRIALLFGLLLAVLPVSLQASGVVPVIFEQAVLTIRSTPVMVTESPEESDTGEETYYPEGNLAMRRVHRLMTEVRRGHDIVPVVALPGEVVSAPMAMRGRLRAGKGVLHLLDEVRPMVIHPERLSVNSDVLLILPDGTIAAILPRVELDIATPTAIKTPIRAILQLAPGQAEALGIKPGDRAEGDILRRDKRPL